MKNKNPYSFKNNELDFDVFASSILHKTVNQLLEANKKDINIGLSGGNTPIPILEKLKDKDVNWERINFFMVDERCVPLTSDLSNFGNISKAFFSKIDSKSFSLVQENKSFEDSLFEYQREISENVKIGENGFPVFDLILLGMGDDGHTASLFPKTEALAEKKQIAVINKVPQLNTKRLTLTYPSILNAKEIIVIVKGSNKEKMINQIYTGSFCDYPIEKIVAKHSNLKWLIG
jgi:6-phosphogluconolactonase